MDWAGLIENFFQMGTLLSVSGVVYGGWLYFKGPAVDKHQDLGVNRPKTVGWRE